METVISVKNVDIRFNLATEKVDSIKEYFIKLFKGQLMFDEFYALKNVSFDVKPGESWALIGTNGSGKSTLLKAISGILEPHRGTIEVNGKIFPMIEISAGFDGDMTAKENIYLNGAFLGYTEAFINSKFDEIVKFAELEDFIDVPVKNFSSGMIARLGFSVATIAKPEILIVDEVLAVGDINFQRKSKQRMLDLIEGGTTLLFVSHDLITMRKLCKKGVWLDKGTVVQVGEINEVCDAYEKANTQN